MTIPPGNGCKGNEVGKSTRWPYWI